MECTGPETARLIRERLAQLKAERNLPPKAKHAATCEENFDYSTLIEGDPAVLHELLEEAKNS